MNLSKNATHLNDTKISIQNKATNLNPNAVAFVPFSIRPSTATVGSTSTSDASRSDAAGTSGKKVLDRSESSISNNSDEEAHQLWRCQLPDDIIPDFKVMNEDESQVDLSLSALSLHNGSETSSFQSSTGSRYMSNDHPELSQHVNGNSFNEKNRFSAPSYKEDPRSTSLLHWPANSRDKQTVINDQLLGKGRDGHPYHGISKHGLMNKMLTEHRKADDTQMNLLEFLGIQFPGFSAESLEEIYFKNGCNFKSTIDMLTQLELQADGGFSQNLNSKALSSPNLRTLDFPAHVLDAQNVPPKYTGNDLHQTSNPYRSMDRDSMLSFKSSSSVSPRGAVDFASAVRKMATQDSIWKYEGNGLSKPTGNSSRVSNVMASTYSSGPERGIYGWQTHGSARTQPGWLEIRDAVANLYTELREEARDHENLRNVCFEQARQAYIIGNKVLAKELSVKGQLHNMYMKAAHGKAQESISRQSNPVGPEMQGGNDGRGGHEHIIDLQGLQLTEAIHVLKNELTVLRGTARATDKHLQVYICVGTGQQQQHHNARGYRPPARLAIAIQRYLLEEEYLDYTEPQPGILLVVVY